MPLNTYELPAFDDCTVLQLKAWLREADLACIGKKPQLYTRLRKYVDARKEAYETRRWNSNKSAGLGNTAAGAVSKDVGKALLNSYKSPGRCAPARPMASHHPLRLSQSIGCWRVGAWWLVAGQQGGDGWALLPQWATGGWVLEA